MHLVPSCGQGTHPGSPQEALPVFGAWPPASVAPPEPVAVPGQERIAEIAKRTGNDGQPGQRPPGKTETAEDVQDGIGARVGLGIGDHGNAAEIVRLHAEGCQESPGRIRLAGSEPKDARRIMPDDEGDPAAAKSAFPVEDDHRGVTGWFGHALTPMLRQPGERDEPQDAQESQEVLGSGTGLLR